jgi:hypothetical protein
MASICGEINLRKVLTQIQNALLNLAKLAKLTKFVTVGRVNTARLLDMCGNHG